MRFKTVKRLFFTGVLGTALWGGYCAYRGCSSEPDPAEQVAEVRTEVRKEPTYAQELEQKVKDKKELPAASLNLLREVQARNPKEFDRYLAEEFKRGDEQVISIYNAFTEAVQDALSKSSHPRDGFSIPPLSVVEARLNYVCGVSGCSYYLTLRDNESGKDYLVTRKDEMGTKRVVLDQYNSLREQIDKYEPKLTMAMPGKMVEADKVRPKK